jgi:hypothetical protein
MRLTHTIQNNLKTNLSFWLEPWAEQFDIPPGSTLRLLCDCAIADNAAPHVEVTPEFLTYWFGSKCRIRVWLDDQEVTSPASWAVPSP